MDILTLFTCFGTLTTTTAVRQLSIIAQAMLTMTGRITMLSLSRWTEKGGSYRTIQRFFAITMAWSEMLVEFFQKHLFNPKHEYILAGDATTVTKSGSRTHGIGFFFWDFRKSSSKYRVLCLFVDRCYGAQIVSVNGQTNDPQRSGKRGDKREEKEESEEGEEGEEGEKEVERTTQRSFEQGQNET